MIRFNCFACKKSIKAPDGLAGKMGKCPPVWPKVACSKRRTATGGCGRG